MTRVPSTLQLRQSGYSRDRLGSPPCASVEPLSLRGPERESGTARRVPRIIADPHAGDPLAAPASRCLRGPCTEHRACARSTTKRLHAATPLRSQHLPSLRARGHAALAVLRCHLCPRQPGSIRWKSTPANCTDCIARTVTRRSAGVSAPDTRHRAPCGHVTCAEPVHTRESAVVLGPAHRAACVPLLVLFWLLKKTRRIPQGSHRAQ